MNPYRLGASAVGFALFFGFSALYFFGESKTYYELLYHWGISPFPFPFVDTSFGLAAWECTRLGVDVVAYDPCDVLGRAYSYSPLWMSAAAIPLGVTSTAQVGWTLGFVFLASLALLPAPRRPWELAMVVLATISTMVVFAVERGNQDLVVFILATLAGLVALGTRPTRFLSYPIVIFGALALKYYPITLMILTLRERLSIFIAMNIGGLALILAFIVSYFSDLQRGIPLIPAGPFDMDLFSFKNIPRTIASGLEKSQLSALQLDLAVAGVYIILLISNALICWFLVKNARFRECLAKLTAHESIFLTMGGALIVGCFFAAQNIGYRGIYFLFVLPGMLAFSRNANGKALRAVGLWTILLIVLIMWGECIRRNLFFLYVDSATRSEGILVATVGFWFLRELAWWWVVSILMAVLLEFVLVSQAFQAVSQYVSRRRESPIV